jgi:TolA-binding protein
VQLAWRNYLIPVDAEIASIDELRQRAIDMNSVIDGIRKAGNPMNIIILDACRDNPFRAQAQVEQRGLSQMDAPRATLLAYATAPGHTAADGDGVHGLYTEHLLREIRVPEAQVEDVFKRVRLAVRRRSNGRQIPWESTSLEQDFWFVPPREVRELAEAEATREFQKELAVWEEIKASGDPNAFERYLRRYPSGRFSELAQLRLDRLLAAQGEKRVEAVTAPQNPYSKGSARANTAHKIGDRYGYRMTDLFTGLEQGSPRFVVTGITDTEVIYNKGRSTEDLLGNELKMRGGVVYGPNQMAPLEFAIGKRWSTRFNVTNPRGLDLVVHLDLQITTRESIEVPAGTFDAFRVEGAGWARGGRVNARWELKRWYAPERVHRWIKWEMLITGARKIVNARRFELVSFRQS